MYVIMYVCPASVWPKELALWSIIFEQLLALRLSASWSISRIGRCRRTSVGTTARLDCFLKTSSKTNDLPTYTMNKLNRTAEKQALEQVLALTISTSVGTTPRLESALTATPWKLRHTFLYYELLSNLHIFVLHTILHIIWVKQPESTSAGTSPRLANKLEAINGTCSLCVFGLSLGVLCSGSPHRCTFLGAVLSSIFALFATSGCRICK